MAKAISVRLSDRDLKSVEKLAKANERSRSYIIQKAVETYVAEEGDYRLALDRLRDAKDEVISSRELRRRLKAR